MKEEKVTARIEEAIRGLLSRGRTARLAVDALRPGVDVPEPVRDRWGRALVLDLDPAMPLNLAWDGAAFHATLAFHPIIERCTIPLLAIYAVIDRTSGAGTLFPENVPPEVGPAAAGARSGRRGVSAPASMTPWPDRPSDPDPMGPAERRRGFRVIRGGKR